jgi:hypothetical protein
MTNIQDDDGSLRTVLIAIVVTALAILAFMIPTPTEEQPPAVHIIETAHAADEYVAEAKEVRLQVIKTDHSGDTDEMVVEKAGDRELPPLHPELAVICSCESAGHSHKNADGTLLSGFIDSRDKGECQINTYYHGETMEKMGLDITDDVDYRTYANYLFETQGRQPWMASASCWAPIIGY